MKDKIQILGTHPNNNYYSFKSVRIEINNKTHERIAYRVGEEISINEDAVNALLDYFLYRYLNNSLPFNNGEVLVEEQGTHQKYPVSLFYTYRYLRAMLIEIKKVIELLENDYNNPKLHGYKKSVATYYRLYTSNSGIPEDFKNNISIITDLYRKFVSQISEMIKTNKETFLFLVTGY